ncbi:MAG: histidine kinase [Spirochaetales bacterium]|nr:histidine kinase [Candidatus Physcosoma equi]
MASHETKGILQELLLLFLCALLFPILYFRGMLSLPLTSIMNISMDIAALAIVLILHASTIYNHSTTRGSRVFRYLVLVEFIALYTDILAWVVDGVPGLRWVNILNNTVFYLCSVGIAYFYLLFVVNFLHLESKGFLLFRRVSRTGGICMTTLMLLNIFTGWVFTVSPENVYSRSFLYPFTFLFPLVVLVTIPYFIMKVDDLNPVQKGALIGYCVTPIVSAAIQTFTYGVSFMYILTLVALLCLYVLIYLKQGEDLVEKKSVLLQKKEQLDVQEQMILLSQIRPKYILSALDTVSELCLTNADEAFSLTTSFSEYLRHNLDSMSGASVDSFVKELSNIERFAEVEEKRLGDRACILYDIGPTNFKIPVLTVQVLVEKAVSRGLAENQEDIWVWVKTTEDDESYHVIIETNAVKVKLEDFQSSPEIQSVRSRLGSLSNGTLTYAIHEGNGCSVTLSIPKV